MNKALRISPNIPSGAVDCHAHVFEPTELALVQNLDSGYQADEGGYLRHLAETGCEKGILVQPQHHRTDNSYLLRVIANNLDRLRGVGVVDSDVPVDELRQLKEGGILGVRLGGVVPISAAADLMPKLADNEMSLHILAEPHHLDQVQNIVEHSSVPVVLDHLVHLSGTDLGSESDRKVDELIANPRVFIKLSAPYRYDGNEAGRNARNQRYLRLLDLAEDQCLWGSDWPHLGSANINARAYLQEFLDICSPKQAEAVFCKNPSRLYGLPRKVSNG